MRTVGAFLVSYAEEQEYKVSYWREKDDEVDYVIEKEDSCVAIEVKSGRRGMNSGIPKFKEKYHPAKAIIVGTKGIALEDFFSCNIDDLF